MPIGIFGGPRGAARIALPQGDELQHVARAVRAVRCPGVGDVEVRDHHGAGGNVAHEHLARFHAVQVGVEMAAGQQPRRPHRQRHVVGEVEDVDGAWPMPAGAASAGVAVLMPAGARNRTLAHARIVLERIELAAGFLQRFAVVRRAVRRPSELRAKQTAQGAAQHRRLHQLPQLRNARQHVVARPRRLVLHAVVQFVRHRGVEIRRQGGIQHEETVGEETPHLVVRQQNRLLRGHATRPPLA